MAIKMHFIRSLGYFPQNSDDYIEELTNMVNIFTNI